MADFLNNSYPAFTAVSIWGFTLPLESTANIPRLSAIYFWPSIEAPSIELVKALSQSFIPVLPISTATEVPSLKLNLCLPSISFTS